MCEEINFNSAEPDRNSHVEPFEVLNEFIGPLRHRSVGGRRDEDEGGVGVAEWDVASSGTIEHDSVIRQCKDLERNSVEFESGIRVSTTVRTHRTGKKFCTPKIDCPLSSLFSRTIRGPAARDGSSRAPIVDRATSVWRRFSCRVCCVEQLCVFQCNLLNCQHGE